MKKIAIVALMLAACGYSSKDSELTGQVKKVQHRTPPICPDYYMVDVSLGVIRNGVGSMSHEDITLYVPSKNDVDALKRAADTGQLVKLTYDVERVVICHPDHEVTGVVLLSDGAVK